MVIEIIEKFEARAQCHAHENRAAAYHANDGIFVRHETAQDKTRSQVDNAAGNDGFKRL